MSLNFLGISPHPPIIVPGIGKNDDILKASKTVTGMKRLAKIFNAAEIDTLVVVSPHMLVYPDRFNICGMEKSFGSFANFGSPDHVIELQNDLDFAIELNSLANKNGLESQLFNNNENSFELDHGTMVPLHYLTADQQSPLKIVPLAYSGLPRSDHFAFGQVIQETAQKNDRRIGILASGDLSHQLIQSIDGKKFDEKLVTDLKEKNTKSILYYEEDFVEKGAECGYRSILILLGAMEGINATPEIISYEGPFGVGYLVANYQLSESFKDADE